MKKIIVALSLLFGVQSFGQELPQLSPKAEFEQNVGLTEIEVEYSRPSMRGRKKYLVICLPYGEVWRTGANGRATIEFEDPILINGKEIKPGKYAILTIPNKESWVVMLNSDTKSWGSNNFNR